jgi:hypothetical protein
MELSNRVYYYKENISILQVYKNDEKYIFNLYFEIATKSWIDKY